MVMWSSPEVKLFVGSILEVMPETYTLAETLRVFRAFFPVLLTLLITMLDFTLDRIPDNLDDPLGLLKKIMDQQDELRKEATELEKMLDTTEENFPKVGWQTHLGEEDFIERVRNL